MLINWKKISKDLKKLSDLVSQKVLKKTMYNKLNSKVNNLDIEISDVTTSIHINQYNTDKQNLDKKIEDVARKLPDIKSVVAATVFITTITEVEKKIPDVSG